jgi:hypothetical protein
LRKVISKRRRSGTRAQFLARRLAGPRSRIQIANDAQPFFRFTERGEVTHVQAEALAIVFAAAADEKAEAFELGRIGMRQRHRRGR